MYNGGGHAAFSLSCIHSAAAKAQPRATCTAALRRRCHFLRRCHFQRRRHFLQKTGWRYLKGSLIQRLGKFFRRGKELCVCSLCNQQKCCFGRGTELLVYVFSVAGWTSHRIWPERFMTWMGNGGSEKWSCSPRSLGLCSPKRPVIVLTQEAWDCALLEVWDCARPRGLWLCLPRSLGFCSLGDLGFCSPKRPVIVLAQRPGIVLAWGPWIVLAQEACDCARREAWDCARRRGLGQLPWTVRGHLNISVDQPQNQLPSVFT